MDKSSLYLIKEADLTFGKHLGHGYFGVVYCAHWRQPDGNRIECAIKVLNQDKSDYTQEIMNMENLRHENIVQLYGLSFDQKRRACIVLEYCEDGSLLERLRDQEKPNVLVTKLLDYSIQIVRGMRYLEKNGYIHRDLAARNVLLTQNEKVVKIGDFGLSRFVPHQVNSQQMEYHQKTDTPFPFAWCPPEVLLSRKYSNASDVWAFGVTLWELFSYGEHPYAGMSSQEVLEDIGKERLKKPKNCLEEIYKIMRSCWEYDAAKRSHWLVLADALQDCKFPIVIAIKPSTMYAYGSVETKVGFEYIVINDVDTTNFYGQCKMTGVFGNIEKSHVKNGPNEYVFSQTNKSVSEIDISFDSRFSSGWSASRPALPPHRYSASPVPLSQAPHLRPTSIVTPLSQPNNAWTNLDPEPLKRNEIEPRTTSNKLCECLPPFEGNKKCYIITICVICAILVAVAIIATIVVLVTKKHNNSSNGNNNKGPNPTETPTGLSTKASDPGCPSGGGWSAYNDKCYKLYTGTQTFKDAATTCQQEGGNLVTIHNADENNFVLDIASSYTNDPSWIGMIWIPYGSCSTGNYCDNSSDTISCPSWIDGTSVDYFNLIGSCTGTQQTRFFSISLFYEEYAYFEKRIRFKKKTQYTT
uniref:receptor protein-tyrosine kinase n=1 Tax=Acrobeloides nanus TaxID=290746 RepID=A0A914E007_9BILA